MLKVKDWPPGQDFRGELPRHMMVRPRNALSQRLQHRCYHERLRNSGYTITVDAAPCWAAQQLWLCHMLLLCA
jgi:hypothetical protein